jgi:hypothetical protein
MLRFAWFAPWMLGVCCLKKRRLGAAGALLAAATLLGLFPGAFMVPLAFRAFAPIRQRGRLAQQDREIFGAFSLAALTLVLLTALLPKGFYHWAETVETMKVHARSVSASRVGLLELTAFRGTAIDITWAARQEILAHRALVQRGQLVLLLLPLLGALCWKTPRISRVSAVRFGVPILFVGLSLASYYSVFLIVLLLTERRRPEYLAAWFAVEALAGALGQLDPRPVVPYVYHSALLVPLLGALLVLPGRRRVARAPG